MRAHNGPASGMCGVLPQSDALLCEASWANQCHRDWGGPAWLPAVADEGYEQRTLLVGDYLLGYIGYIINCCDERRRYDLCTYSPLLAPVWHLELTDQCKPTK
jgi:hypothetical protein